MTITADEMREMADKLQAEHDFLISTLPIKSPSGAQTIESEAAAMLRSIAEEREKFDHAYVIDSHGITHRKFTIIFDGDEPNPKGAV